MPYPPRKNRDSALDCREKAAAVSPPVWTTRSINSIALARTMAAPIFLRSFHIRMPRALPACHHHGLPACHRCWEPNSAARDSRCSRAGLHSPKQPKASACTCPKDANFAAMGPCAPGSVELDVRGGRLPLVLSLDHLSTSLDSVGRRAFRHHHGGPVEVQDLAKNDALNLARLCLTELNFTVSGTYIIFYRGRLLAVLLLELN